MDLTGHISGAKVIFHREPHVYQDEIAQPQLDTFLARISRNGGARRNRGARRQFRRPASRLCRGSHNDRYVDARRGFSILPQLVLIGRSLMKAKVSPPAVDVDGFTQMSWDDLLAEGSIVHKVITDNDVARSAQQSQCCGREA